MCFPALTCSDFSVDANASPRTSSRVVTPPDVMCETRRGTGHGIFRALRSTRPIALPAGHG